MKLSRQLRQWFSRCESSRSRGERRKRERGSSSSLLRSAASLCAIRDGTAVSKSSRPVKPPVAHCDVCVCLRSAYGNQPWSRWAFVAVKEAYSPPPVPFLSPNVCQRRGRPRVFTSMASRLVSLRSESVHEIGARRKKDREREREGRCAHHRRPPVRPTRLTCNCRLLVDSLRLRPPEFPSNGWCENSSRETKYATSETRHLTSARLLWTCDRTEISNDDVGLHLFPG